MVKKQFVVNPVSKNNVNTKCDLDNVDIEEALALTGHGWYDFLLLLTCCIIHLGAVTDMLGYSLVVPAAACDLQLTLKQSGMLTSAAFAAFMFALVWGYTADKYGRKKALFISSSVGFLLSTLTTFSTSFYMMLVLKFLSTCFSTASTTLTITFLGECTPRDRRNRYVFGQNVASLASDFVCYSIAYFILPMDFKYTVPWLKTYRPWRLMAQIMTLPLGIGSMLLCLLHESPKFLANQGETDKALETLAARHKTNYGKRSVYPVSNSLQKVDKPDSTISFWESVVKQTVPVFKPPLLWRTLQLFLLLSISCGTNNVFYMWFPTMVNSFYTAVSEDIGFCQKIVANITPIQVDDICIDTNPMNTIYAGLIFSLTFTILNAVSILVANWRRTLMITIFFISGICCVLVDIVRQPVAGMVIFIAIQLTGICIGSVGSYYVDLFPTSVRGLATSVGMMFARFVCLSGVNLVGASIIDYCRITFYGWAIFVFSGIVATLFLPAEAKPDSSDKK